MRAYWLCLYQPAASWRVMWLLDYAFTYACNPWGVPDATRETAAQKLLTLEGCAPPRREGTPVAAPQAQPPAQRI